MKYRRLGKTDLNVSVIGIGTWQYGGEWGQTFTPQDVSDILNQGTDCGINLIDTAECYGDHLSEKLIGQAIAGKRDQWILATKFGHQFNAPFNRDDVYAPDKVQEQLEASLRALRTDYIDLYQFHSGTDESFNTSGLWDMLQKQQQAGKIRHLGISLGSKYQGTHQIQTAADVGASTFQVVYNRLTQGPETTLFPTCIEKDFGVLARVPLASGFLSGKYTHDTQFPNNDVRKVWKTDQERQDLLNKVQSLRSEIPEGIPMAQWALAWCLKHQAVTTVIPGCRTPEQVVSNATAAEIVLS